VKSANMSTEQQKAVAKFWTEIAEAIDDMERTAPTEVVTTWRKDAVARFAEKKLDSYTEMYEFLAKG